MDPIEKMNKISVSSIIFGVIVLLLAWIITEVSNPLMQLQIGEFALVFLSMFFFSLVNDRLEEMEKIMKEN